MKVYLYYRTYWGKDSSSGMSGRNVLAESKGDLVETCLKSLELEGTGGVYTCACVDHSTPDYTAFLESRFDEVYHTSEGFDVNDHFGKWPTFDLRGNLAEVLRLIESRGHSEDDVILLLEDDYLFAPNGFASWISACQKIDGFVSPFDHPDRYYRSDDMYFEKTKIMIMDNTHFRNSESSTSVVGGLYKYFKRTYRLRMIPRFHLWFYWPGRIFGKELPSIDRVFYRRAYRWLGVKLFSPIPGFATHLSKFIPPEDPRFLLKGKIPPPTQLSPGFDWVKRFDDLHS
jgi:hypothetical protein